MKLNKNDREMLWGESGPYSEAKIVINTRILDDSVSRVMIEVEGNVNPTTFKIVQKNIDHFADDEIILQLIESAVYRGKGYGYQIAASYEEFADSDVMKRAQAKLDYMKDALIRMHRFVMDYLGIEDEELAWQNAAGTDAIKYLGKMSKKEFDYYEKLKPSAKRKK
jgi:hypothetical protein